MLRIRWTSVRCAELQAKVFLNQSVALQPRARSEWERERWRLPPKGRRRPQIRQRTTWLVGAFPLAGGLGDIERQERRARPRMQPRNQQNLGCRKRILRWRPLLQRQRSVRE